MPYNYEARMKQLHGILMTQDNMNKYNQLLAAFDDDKRALVGKSGTSQIQKIISRHLTRLESVLPDLIDAQQAAAQENASMLVSRRLF